MSTNPRLRPFAARLALAGAALVAVAGCDSDKLVAEFRGNTVMLTAEAPAARLPFRVRLHPDPEKKAKDTKAWLTVVVQARRLGEATGNAGGPHRIVAVGLAQSRSPDFIDRRVTTADPGILPNNTISIPLFGACGSEGSCEEGFELFFNLLDPVAAPGVVLEWSAHVEAELNPDKSSLELLPF